MINYSRLPGLVDATRRSAARNFFQTLFVVGLLVVSQSLARSAEQNQGPFANPLVTSGLDAVALAQWVDGTANQSNSMAVQRMSSGHVTAASSGPA